MKQRLRDQRRQQQQHPSCNPAWRQGEGTPAELLLLLQRQQPGASAARLELLHPRKSSERRCRRNGGNGRPAIAPPPQESALQRGGRDGDREKGRGRGSTPKFAASADDCAWLRGGGCSGGGIGCLMVDDITGGCCCRMKNGCFKGMPVSEVFLFLVFVFVFFSQLVAAWEKTKDRCSVLRGKTPSPLRDQADWGPRERGLQRGSFPRAALALLKARPRERTRGRGEDFSSAPRFGPFSQSRNRVFRALAFPRRGARSPG